jgi:hypothetical protein
LQEALPPAGESFVDSDEDAPAGAEATASNSGDDDEL